MWALIIQQPDAHKVVQGDPSHIPCIHTPNLFEIKNSKEQNTRKEKRKREDSYVVTT